MPLHITSNVYQLVTRMIMYMNHSRPLLYLEITYMTLN
jgi:hypothetical protein